MSVTENDVRAVESYFNDLHDTITDGLEALDGEGRFRRDSWRREAGGGGEARVLTDGAVFEKAGINFSHVTGTSLPPSATAHRPELACRW